MTKEPELYHRTVAILCEDPRVFMLWLDLNKRSFDSVNFTEGWGIKFCIKFMLVRDRDSLKGLLLDGYFVLAPGPNMMDMVEIAHTRVIQKGPPRYGY